MSRFHILVSGFSAPDDVVEQAAAGTDAVLDIVRAEPGIPTELPAALRERADAVAHCTPNQPLSNPPEAFPRCRIVVRNGVGFDNIDIKAWGQRGIPVCNVPDYGTAEVADHAIALMLAFTRGTATYIDALRSDLAGNWSHAIAPLVRRHRGAVFGIVGLGRIGTAAALRAQAFGMPVAFHDPYLASGMELALGLRRCASLEELMATCDVISVHAPLSAETTGLLGRKALAVAKPGLILVNTARGQIVDLDALHDALRQGRVAAAGLDVTPGEPPAASHPLIAAYLARESWIAHRLILTPHAAFYSPASIIDLRRKTIETLVEFLRDGKLKNCVNDAHLRRSRSN
jgi:D-3-phosphoglycerate dehydrogenase/C-terminal binding protein